MEKLVKDVVRAAHHLYERGLVFGTNGNVSGRFIGDIEIVAITPTNVPLSMVTEENVAIVDMSGRKLGGAKPSSELYLHLKIYGKREDVEGIVHTHSPYATAFSFSNKRLRRFEIPGESRSGFIEEVEYYMPGSMELANECALKMEHGNVALLKNHGVVCCGPNLQEAVQLSEFVEENAKLQFISYLLNSLKGD